MRIHNTNIFPLVLKPFPVQIVEHKPKGLWYGIDDAWIDWCKSEMPDWVHSHNYVLDLDEKKLLVIKDEKELLDFHRTYSVPACSGIVHIKYPDWLVVAKQFGGIEINPYIYHMRLSIDMTWYYGWDCASGCVWDKSAILGVRKP